MRTAVAPHRGDHAREALGAFEFRGQSGGRGQRVQRVAGDDRVHRPPTAAARSRAERQVAEAACGCSGAPRAPQPVGAAQHPRVGAQQPGRGERTNTGVPRRGPLDLERDRPHDQRHVGDVEVALRGEVLDEEATEHQQRRRAAPRRGRSTAARAGMCRRPARRTRRSSRAPSGAPRPARRSSRTCRRAIASGCSVGAR